MQMNGFDYCLQSLNGGHCNGSECAMIECAVIHVKQKKYGHQNVRKRTVMDDKAPSDG